jgi:phenylalanyl-tRNA synthetase beta chain
MRRAIMPTLVRRVGYNLARGIRDVRLFEIGTSFRKGASGERPTEETHLAAVLTGRRRPPHWSHDDEMLEVWDLKGLLEDVAGRAYAGAVVVSPAATGVVTLDDSVSFEVRDASGVVVGHGGRVADSAADTPVWAGDLWALELTLPAHPEAVKPVTVQPLPQYPASERDLALLVPDSITADAVSSLIRERAGDDLEGLELFDVYTGEGVPEGMRSVAFRLRFRSAKRTLKDKQVDKSVRAVLKRLEEELGVEARG